MTFKRIVTELIRDGYAYLSIDSALVANAESANQKLLRTLGEKRPDWALTRHGESEAGMGVLSRPGLHGVYEKTFVHYAHDLPILLELAAISETKQ